MKKKRSDLPLITGSGKAIFLIKSFACIFLGKSFSFLDQLSKQGSAGCECIVQAVKTPKRWVCAELQRDCLQLSCAFWHLILIRVIALYSFFRANKIAKNGQQLCCLVFAPKSELRVLEQVYVLLLVMSSKIGLLIVNVYNIC